MTLEEFYFISQIVAVVGIFGSLIFVGMQLRQNSEQLRRQTQETRYGTMNQVLTDFQQIVNALSHDPLAAQDYFTGHEKGFAAITPERRAAHFMLRLNVMRLYERAFIQRTAARLGDDAWESIHRSFAPVMTGTAARELLTARRETLSPSFAAFLEKELAATAPVSYAQLFPASAPPAQPPSAEPQRPHS
ncbi:MAG TPA: hypothetical protein PL096_00180 [Micropepsaceae bacterium]|nr:hypothetical protein [Micropepsaceae bacterium]